MLFEGLLLSSSLAFDHFRSWFVSLLMICQRDRWRESPAGLSRTHRSMGLAFKWTVILTPASRRTWPSRNLVSLAKHDNVCENYYEFRGHHQKTTEKPLKNGLFSWVSVTAWFTRIGCYGVTKCSKRNHNPTCQFRFRFQSGAPLAEQKSHQTCQVLPHLHIYLLYITNWPVHLCTFAA